MQKKQKANYDAKGWVLCDSTDEILKATFAVINKLSPGEGVSEQDYWKMLEMEDVLCKEIEAEHKKWARQPRHAKSKKDIFSYLTWKIENQNSFKSSYLNLI